MTINKTMASMLLSIFMVVNGKIKVYQFWE